MNEILTILEVNAETNKTIERPLTAGEIAERQEMQAQAEAQKAEQETKAAARESALAKLADLGLTSQEIAAL